MPTSVELRSGTHSLVGKNQKDLRQQDVIEALNSIYENFKAEGLKLEISRENLKHVSFNVLTGIKNYGYESSEIVKKFTIKMGIFNNDKKYSIANVNVVITRNDKPTTIYTYTSSEYNAAKILRDKEKPNVVLTGNELKEKQKQIAKK